MKMVYNIGARYGYQLDSGHVKEFLAVLAWVWAPRSSRGCA